MSLHNRLSALEQKHNPTDDLVQQAIRIWGYSSIELSQAEAEEIAESYRARGLSSITWESLMTVNPDEIKGFE